MDTLFWTNLKANNNQVKFEGSKTLRWGFTSSLHINSNWLYCCLYKVGSVGYKQMRESVIDRLYWHDSYVYEHNTRPDKKKWLIKNKKSIEAKEKMIADVINYKENHKNLKFTFNYWDTTVYGSESEIIELLQAIPKLAEVLAKVSIPSSDESEQMIKDGYILARKEPPMPFRAKTSVGYIKITSLEKVVRQVKLSPGRYAISGWFQKKAEGANNWRNLSGTSTWMGSSNIYFKSEHDIAMFSLIDPALTKKIEKISLDPGLNEIAKLNKVRKV